MKRKLFLLLLVFLLIGFVSCGYEIKNPKPVNTEVPVYGVQHVDGTHTPVYPK